MIRVFQALDLDGDGQLSREELIIGKILFVNFVAEKIGYTQIMESKDPAGDVEAILKAVDSNRSGCIEYTGKF